VPGIRAVIDTNVFVSGIISPKGSPRKVLDAALEEQFRVITSITINHEILSVLHREHIYVFDAKLLEPLFRELIKRTLEKEGKLTGIEKQLVAVDATIIQSVSKAFWALWSDDEHRAVKLHLELDINNWVPTIWG
jgi:putative PIN family toxin of toxin-antitoxin system